MTFLPDPYVLENDSRTLNPAGVQRNFEAIDGAYTTTYRNSVALIGANGWDNYGGGFQQAVVNRVGPMVVVVGLIKKTGSFTGGEVVLTLPVGYRPATTQIFGTVGKGAGAEGPAGLAVFPNGEVQVRSGYAATAGAVDYLSVNFSFLAF